MTSHFSTTTDLSTSSRRHERGFTLIEVMVVVLIIGILLAIGIPTFLGARERAQDRAAETSLRTAETTARLLFNDENSFLVGISEFEAAEPSLGWVTGPSSGPQTVSISSQNTATGTAFNATIASDSGACFHLTLRSNGDRLATRSQSSSCGSGAGMTSSLSAAGTDAILSGTFGLDSNGFIGAPEGSGYESSAGAGGTAIFTFTVTEAGNYRLIATASAPDGSSDSFWVRTSLDNYGSTYLWDVSARTVSTDYVNDRGSGGQDVLFSIPAGTTVTVEVSPREDGTLIQSMDLVPS